MIREIVHDILFLQLKSEKAGKEDLTIVKDLTDTLKYHEQHCVGMAANMIGYHKRIIAMRLGPVELVMLNPEIVSKKKAYKTKEGCLSLIGERETVRYEEIEVVYEDVSFQKQRRKFTGYPAQIIQHEIDHCEGVLI